MVRLFSVPAVAALCFLAAILYGCANIVPPEGGKKDETPPVLLSLTPPDSSLNSRPSKIVLHFDEYVEVRDLEKNLQLSPLLNIPPTILSYGKRVEIKIQDTQLQKNTTYSINLGDALVDNHEGNPYKGFVYQFSTGDYFDSLELKGNIYDAATGMPDTAALITLYTGTEDDTAVLRRKPVYAVKANSSGSFIIRSLPSKEFRIYAVQDANNNYVYDYGEEKIGFLNTVVMPSLHPDTAFNLYLFREIRDTTAAAIDTLQHNTDTATVTTKPEAGGSRRKGNNKTQARVATGYRVNVDTSDRTQRSFELTQPLTIDLSSELMSLDTAKVYLSYENAGIEVEAIQKVKVDSTKITISTEWQPDKVYTLRLVKGWSKDTSGAELPPGKYFFRTKRTEDYSTLMVHIGQQYRGDSFLLYVYKGTDSIYLKPVRDSVVQIPLLQPGNYSMRMIIDANHNGKWDPGVLLLHQQPEKVIPHASDLVLKAGWENEADFIPADKNKRKPIAGSKTAGSPGNKQDDAEK